LIFGIRQFKSLKANTNTTNAYHQHLTIAGKVVTGTKVEAAIHTISNIRRKTINAEELSQFLPAFTSGGEWWGVGVGASRINLRGAGWNRKTLHKPIKDSRPRLRKRIPKQANYEILLSGG